MYSKNVNNDKLDQCFPLIARTGKVCSNAFKPQASRCVHFRQTLLTILLYIETLWNCFFNFCNTRLRNTGCSIIKPDTFQYGEVWNSATMSLLLQHGSRFNPHCPTEIGNQYGPGFLSQQTHIVDNWDNLQNQDERKKNMGDCWKLALFMAQSPVFNNQRNPENKMVSVALVVLWFQLSHSYLFWERLQNKEGGFCERAKGVLHVSSYPVFNSFIRLTLQLFFGADLAAP